ncbi:MAG: MFS transporter [Actinomycetota bacterium]|nr:MFS transporter [Actinomycetota bacterium]
MRTVGGQDDAGAAHTPVPGARRIIVLTMVAAAVAQPFGRFTLALVLPAVEDDLGLSHTAAGSLVALNLAAYLVGTIGVSALALRWAPTTLVRRGLVLSVSGLAAVAAAPTFAVIVAGQVLTGLGGAMIWIPAPAVAASTVPPERRGWAIGTVSAGIGTGILVSSLLAGVVRGTFGDASWRPVYAVELVVGIVALAAVLRWYRTPVAAAVAAPVRLGAIRQVPGWVPLTIAYSAFGLAYALFFNFLVTMLEEDAHFGATHTAAISAVLSTFVIGGGMLVGRISDRIGRRPALLVAFVVMSTCALAVLTGVEPVVVVAAGLFGIVFSGIPAVIASVVNDHLDQRSFGAAFGAITLAFGVTQVVAPQLGGLLGDAYGSFTPVFVASAAAAAVGAVASARLPHPPRAVPGTGPTQGA